MSTKNKAEAAPVIGQHTPGPWKDHGATVYEVDKWKDGNNLGGQCVALCYQPMADECPTEEQFANARLIASAPALFAEKAALLEALKRALAVMMEDRKPNNRSNYCYHWIVKPLEPCDCAICEARAAIAQAGGAL
jgi:hypothetical protein